MKLISLILLASASCLSTGVSEAADVEIQGFDGQIQGPDRFPFEKMAIQISWRCYKSAFTGTGYKNCKDANASGRVTVPVYPDGTFSVPDIQSNSVWRAYFPVTVSIISADEEGRIIGRYCDKNYYQNPVPVSEIQSDLQSLTIVEFESDTFSMNILAEETGRAETIPFVDLREWYPQSYNDSLEAQLRVTYDKVPGVVRKNSWHATYAFTWRVKPDGRFLVVPKGIWIIRGFQEGADLEFEFKFQARIGLKSKDTEYRFVKKEVSRKAHMKAERYMKLPATLFQGLEEIVVDLDE